MIWFKENWFKLALLLSLSIVSLTYINYLNTKEYNRTQEEEKKYFANKKADCLNIFKVENEKWNNVTGWRYSESSDTCYVEYKNKETDEKFENSF